MGGLPQAVLAVTPMDKLTLAELGQISNSKGRIRVWCLVRSGFYKHGPYQDRRCLLHHRQMWGMTSLPGRYGCVRATAYAQPKLDCMGCRVLHRTMNVIDHHVPN